MEIISISLDKRTLEDLNKTQEKLGFKSRSKLLRSTINSLLNEYAALDRLSGHCDVVFTITYNHNGNGSFGAVMKDFEDIIKTEIHQHHAQKCLRILIVCGDAKKVRDFYAVLKRERQIKSVSYTIL